MVSDGIRVVTQLSGPAGSVMKSERGLKPVSLCVYKSQVCVITVCANEKVVNEDGLMFGGGGVANSERLKVVNTKS